MKNLHFYIVIDQIQNIYLTIYIVDFMSNFFYVWGPLLLQTWAPHYIVSQIARYPMFI